LDLDLGGEKSVITASVLAARSGVPIYTIRHYTRIGLLKPSRDPGNGYKLYRTSDAERLRFIISAKDLGFTLAEIEEILDHAVHGDSPCPMVRDVVEKRVVENKQKIRDLKKMQKRLEGALNMWQGMKNGMPTGDSVCVLIETFAGEEHGGLT
jgi:MerR family transcriptional regulator, Zn(II)-responsive regulator of zntA